jgi:holo-[acyl-carrier protein] synthase
MLLGIGIDILSIPRLQGLIARRGAARVAQRICSSRELASFDQLKDKVGGDQEQLAAQQLRFLCAR